MGGENESRPARGGLATTRGTYPARLSVPWRFSAYCAGGRDSLGKSITGCRALKPPTMERRVCICGSGPQEGNNRRPAEYEGDGQVNRVGAVAGVREGGVYGHVWVRVGSWGCGSGVHGDASVLMNAWLCAGACVHARIGGCAYVYGWE